VTESEFDQLLEGYARDHGCSLEDTRQCATDIRNCAPALSLDELWGVMQSLIYDEARVPHERIVTLARTMRAMLAEAS
jgi:hypothetical protein